MRDFATEKYEVLAGIDEAFKRLQTQTASLKNAEDIYVNRVTLQKIADEVKDVKNRCDLYEILCQEEEQALYEEAMAQDDSEDDGGYSEYATGASYLGGI